MTVASTIMSLPFASAKRVLRSTLRDHRAGMPRSHPDRRTCAYRSTLLSTHQRRSSSRHIRRLTGDVNGDGTTRRSPPPPRRCGLGGASGPHDAVPPLFRRTFVTGATA